MSGRDIACDNSVAAENDGCAEVGAIACSTDHKTALECGPDHKFEVGETCRGAHGCSVAGGSVDCDNDTSEVGDRCHAAGDYACSGDKALLLRCEDRKMAPHNACRGPKGCRVVERPQEKKIDFICDDSLAKEGDPCDANGEQACALDKTAMYVCRANVFGSFKTCAGAGGCSHDEATDTYACDEGNAAPAPPAKKATAATPKPGSPAPSKKKKKS